MKASIWVLGLLAVYSYLLYPLILIFVRCFNGARSYAGARMCEITVDEWPHVSLIITAHNEQKRIRNKIENALKLRYPSGRLQIIVASDGSTDSTDSIVELFSSNGVRLVRTSRRLGKENAQLEALREASGSVIVFSDVSTTIPEGALENLVGYFQHPEVGAVSSEDRFVSSDGQLAGEGLYVKYEMWLRRLESAIGGLVGLSGSFFAVRKDLCSNWDIHSPSDFNTALNCARAGLRAVTARDVLGYYPDLQGREYQRKVRTVLRGMTAVVRHPDVLNPIRLGVFAWQVWSHKLLRWVVPWILPPLLAVSILLASEGVAFAAFLFIQVIFYSLGLLGWLSRQSRRLGLVRVAYFFCQANLAIAEATVRLLAGNRMTTWQPSDR
jgi:cellulose synthase/poly-beta-1,6-N-acetylglucosamine synthase-like glycosyltransferase